MTTRERLSLGVNLSLVVFIVVGVAHMALTYRSPDNRYDRATCQALAAEALRTGSSWTATEVEQKCRGGGR
jgi:hypothetical protein